MKLSLRIRLSAVLLLLAPVQYWVLEAVSSLAWKNPGYSYIFISDLGAPEVSIRFQGRYIDSPLQDLMNFSFVLLGVLVFGAVVLLAPLLTRR
ncbi:MAG: hypothetical protein WA982_11870 [Rubrobacteraceae bacterium]